MSEEIPPEEETVAEETTVEEAPETLSVQELELEQLRDYKEKYLLLLAESENLRKRFQRDRQESIKHAVSDAIAEFLRPLDQLEGALKMAEQSSDEVKNWAIGFEMIVTHFKDALAAQGITSFESMGQPFDPHLHEAIEMIETDDHPDGVVVEETVRGYKMGDRTLRPAQVKVSKKPGENS